MTQRRHGACYIRGSAQMKNLAVVVLLFVAGCAGRVEPEPVPSAECVAYHECEAVEAAYVSCTDGDCVCSLPTHPGNNHPEVCRTNEPDYERNPIGPWP